MVRFVMTADEERKVRKVLVFIGRPASQDAMNDIRRRLFVRPNIPHAAQWARDDMITNVLEAFAASYSPIPDNLFGVSH